MELTKVTDHATVAVVFVLTAMVLSLGEPVQQPARGLPMRGRSVNTVPSISAVFVGLGILPTDYRAGTIVKGNERFEEAIGLR